MSLLHKKLLGIKEVRELWHQSPDDQGAHLFAPTDFSLSQALLHLPVKTLKKEMNFFFSLRVDMRNFHWRAL